MIKGQSTLAIMNAIDFCPRTTREINSLCFPLILRKPKHTCDFGIGSVAGHEHTSDFGRPSTLAVYKIQVAISFDEQKRKLPDVRYS